MHKTTKKLKKSICHFILSSHYYLATVVKIKIKRVQKKTQLAAAVSGFPLFRTDKIPVFIQVFYVGCHLSRFKLSGNPEFKFNEHVSGTDFGTQNNEYKFSREQRFT